VEREKRERVCLVKREMREKECESFNQSCARRKINVSYLVVTLQLSIK